MRFCKDCEHCRFDLWTGYVCKRKVKEGPDPVTGNHKTWFSGDKCDTERAGHPSAGRCGPDAQFFKEKEG